MVAWTEVELSWKYTWNEATGPYKEALFLSGQTRRKNYETGTDSDLDVYPVMYTNSRTILDFRVSKNFHMLVKHETLYLKK